MLAGHHPTDDVPQNCVARDTCRVCGKQELTSVLNLGQQPLANRFLTLAEVSEPEPRYPLEMVRCAACGHCQLTHVVDPEVLYRDYFYESGHSEGWHQHCRELAQEISETDPGGRVLDIACNDGTLLRYCRDRGCVVLGVDPALNVDSGEIPVHRVFWPANLGEQFDVIVAQNVFGHVDDARGFLQGIAGALADNGIVIIECPWVVDLLRHQRWDTIYHEHLSYWGIEPLQKLAQQVGLSVFDTQYYPNLHGGTLRYYLQLGEGSSPGAAMAALLYFQEMGDLEFGLKASIQLNQWATYFQEMEGKSIAAYGASAKLNTMLNALPRDPHLNVVFDDNPRKQGHYTPGWHIPVVRPSELLMLVTDEILIGAPNWQAVIEPQARALGFEGTFRSLWP